MNITFGKYGCRVVFAKYNNNRTAILLEDSIDLSTVVVATINIPEHPLDVDEVIIKDYSENSGILDCLIQNKVISEPVRFIQTGYVTVPVCKLLIEPEYEQKE